jgi:hypothetical protein
MSFRSYRHPILPSPIKNDEFVTGLDNLLSNGRKLSIYEVAKEADISCGSCHKKEFGNGVFVSKVYSMTANTEHRNNHMSAVSELA